MKKASDSAVKFVLTTLISAYPLLAFAGDAFEVGVLSSRSDTVSGNDVLVEVKAPSPSRWTASLNGHDVTASFKMQAGTGHSLALLTGLKVGKNRLEVRANGRLKSKLEILNHPLTGPVFSGPHQQPFICQTVENGLGPALDDDCHAKTVVQYYYQSTEPVQTSILDWAKSMDPDPRSLAPGYKPYDLSGPLPPDIAQTVTSDGRKVPYIVRREIGVINRAVYDIQFLHQPGEPLPTPWAHPTPGWNGRLVYRFGGGCGTGYHQGILSSFRGTGAGEEPMLAQGYAVATSTLNVFGNNCNDRVSAETLSMVKEHFIEQFGAPVHTIGWGGSGGAIQQFLIAQNYPGLLDGIVTLEPVPDIVAGRPFDCPLLDRAIKNAKQPWTNEQKAAVSGYAFWTICANSAKWIPDPRDCDQSIPKGLIYDPKTHPTGARCSYYDNEVNVLGRDPHTGFARRPLDNVGIQYGLVAFNSGQIDAEQFVELNELIGGYDQDAHFIAQRTTADREALRIAYQQGLILTGGGGLGQIPIIDWRWYADDVDDPDAGHDLLDSFTIRARLTAANGAADNHVILTDPRVGFFTYRSLDPGVSIVVRRGREQVNQMDRWLDNIAADSTFKTLADKISSNKPAQLADGCWATNGERIIERVTYNRPGRCNQLYPPYGTPRIAAGAPVANDIVKCVVKPINPADYARPLTADQLARLKTVFPDGICDYSRPGVAQQVTLKTWQRY